MKKNPFGRQMSKIFALANVEYGRVDFGVVNGKPQIYEINTNPHVKLRPPPSPAPRRNDSVALFRANYIQALTALDTAQ